jgi:outer membrane assembly lipoprotein YfiO
MPLDSCLAYWIWTPEIGKWINPKYAVKPTPKEQYDWAFKLYKDKEYSKAAEEFDKLVFNYPNSKYAPPSLYYRGICLEEIEYYYEAYRSYDRVLREYPTFKNIEEIIEREFKIGEKFLAGRKRKVMGVKIFPSLDLAIEIFASIAEHAPFSEYGAKSQFNVGVALKKAERYTEAKEAFEKVILNYPNSEIVTRARFEAANCSFLASGKSEYEQTATRQAIKELSQFLDEELQEEDLSQKAKEKLLLLQEKDAEHLYNIAKFYERMKKFKAAHIYYKEVIDKYPQTSFAAKAKEKLEKLKGEKK